MLRNAGVGAEFISDLLRHPHCTESQIRVATQLADRRNGRFRESRGAFINSAIIGLWKPSRTQQERRQERKPEGEQEREALERHRRLASLHRQKQVDAMLEAMGEEAIDKLFDQIIAREKSLDGRRALICAKNNLKVRRQNPVLRGLVFDMIGAMSA